MKRIGIIGAGHFGQALVERLAGKEVELLLIDSDHATIQQLAELVARAYQGDATNPRSLKEAGFQECDVVVVCIGDHLEGSIMAVANCKDLGIPTVVARAVSDLHGRVLKRVGADIVVNPDRDRARRLARSLLTDNPIDLYEIVEGISISDVAPPADTIGKTIIEAAIRQRYGVTVLAIRRPAENPRLPNKVLVASGMETIEAHDRLLVFGADRRIDELAHD